MGAVAWASWQRSVSHPRSSNRSADLRHPALRLVSPMIQTAAKIDAITNGRNAEWSLAFPIRLRNHHPPHRIGPIRLRDQFLAQACKPLLQTRCFDRREGYSVHSRRSRIGAGQRIGMAQDVFPVNLVVEQVEAERRLGLRLTIQLSLKGLDRYRCCQAHRQSPSPHHLRKHTRSQGPLLNWHCPASTLVRPCPTPARTAACRDVEVATLAHDGSPSITRTTFPTCRAHYPGGSSRCMRRFTSPLTRPSPNGRRVGIRIVTFEACSGFTRVTARRIAQPPKATFVTKLQPSQLPGQAARQLPDQSTTLRVESSSTDDSRLRGALPLADIAYRQCGPQRGDRRAKVFLCGVLPLALARRDRARCLTDHIEHHVRLRQHGHMARRDLGRGGFHAFRSEPLQIEMNCLVLGGEDIRTRLCLPRGTFDLLIE